MIPVLLYHSVPRWRCASGDRLSVPRELFESHLDVISACGLKSLTIGELAAGLRNQHTLPERCMAISFDDGYRNTPGALELLLVRGLRATLYLTTGQIGMAGMISAEQTRAIAEQHDRIELGAHSVTHARLDELSSRELTREITHSRCALEDLISRRVETFAYPYGSYDKRVRDAVAGAGFTSAAAVKNAFSHPQDDFLAIARLPVTGDMSAGQISALLHGAGAPLAWKRERLRTRGYRQVRRAKRRLGARGARR